MDTTTAHQIHVFNSKNTHKQPKISKFVAFVHLKNTLMMLVIVWAIQKRSNSLEISSYKQPN